MSGSEIPSDRFHAFDPLRIVAAFGIVAFHFGPKAFSTVGYAGLPTFLLITFALVGLRGKLRLSTDSVKRRFRRLMVPWMAWWIIYLCVRLPKVLRTGAAVGFDYTWLLAGPRIHLWYLPFAFLGTLLASLIVTQAASRSVAGIRLLGALGILSLAVFCQLPGDLRLLPLGEWWVATPSIFIGLCIGLTWRFRTEKRVLELGLLAVGCVIAGGLGCLGARSQAGIAYAIGTVCVIACVLVPKAAPVPGAKALADLTMGVYLIHPLVFLLLTKFLGEEPTLPRAGAIYLCSLLAIHVLRRFPFGRKIT